MDLFSQQIDVAQNHLPYDGEVNYYGKVLNPNDASHFKNALLDKIEWRNDEAHIFGKKIIMALPWTQELITLKKLAETQSGETYNSCLLNLYHNGSEGMAYHSDGEPDLKKDGAIASISLGAERKFSFKHKKTKLRVDLWLENGSLLVMKGTTQTHWVHRLPPTKKVHTPRVNLTFRTIVEG